MNIFQIAKAIGGDDLTSPTIPFYGPVGSITPLPSGVTGPSIMLQTNVVTLKKGEQAKVEVVIFTNERTIKSFKFQLKFNPSVLKVVDADTTKAGTQISYQNTFFIEKNNSVLNTGEIMLEASTSEGVGTINNRVIAYFNVEAIENGSSLIEVVKAESGLFDSTGANLLQSVNSVTMNVTSQTQTTTPIPTITPSFVTPKTGLIDDLGYANAIILGTLLVISGIYLFKKKNSDDLH
jgi:hypothetical protein